MSDVRISEIIAPAFYDVHKAIRDDEKTHFMLSGGRGSCKSSFVSIEVILGIMKDENANAVAIRKVGNTLRDSVFEQLLWAIDKLGVSNYWIASRTPPQLTYIPTGQKILFRGADNPRKLKSTKVSKGYIKYVWYEELDEFSGQEEIDTINQSLLRGGEEFKVFYSYNPPKSPRTWVNSESQIPREDKLVHKSTYLDVPPEWLGKQFVVEAEHLKETNPDRYENEYLGKVTGTGAEVFGNVTVREFSDEELAAFDKHRRGIDWGYGADPFVYVAMHFDTKRKRLYIYHEFYKLAAKYDTIAAAIKAENTLNHTVAADSAEPRSNDELKERGLKIKAAKKGGGSVEHGIMWLQNLEQIIIDPIRCPNTTKEFTQYSLVPDGNGGYKDGYPDKDNHTIDAVRYALEDDMTGKKIATAKKSRYGIY